MTDGEILDLFFSRSDRALKEFEKKHGNYCRHIAKSILFDEGGAEECFNDALLRLWNAIPPARPENLQTYAGKIVRNLALNMREKEKVEKRGGGQTPIALEELAECLPDVQNDPTDELHLRTVLNTFLSELAPDARKIFLRRYWYMASVKEIARDFRVSENAVAVSLFRTREKLKNILEKEGIL